MPNYISLLRGINVSGKNKIQMVDLKALYVELGFNHVETYIQSGNVVFQSPITNVKTLCKKIEDKIQRTFNYSINVIIRTSQQMENIVKNNPYCVDEKKDKTKMHVTFLSDLGVVSNSNKITAAISAPDEFHITKNEIYLYCPNGYGKSKLSNSFFEKQLAIAATTRNWRTVNKLMEMTKGD